MSRKRSKVANSSRDRDVATTSSSNRIRHGAFITLRAGSRLKELNLLPNPGRVPHYLVAFQCEICFWNYPWDEVVLDSCSGPCAFCQDCLQMMMEDVIGDWSKFDIYCSQDKVLDPKIILENAFDKSTVHRYLEVKLKVEDPNVTYCHSCQQYLQNKGARAKSNARSCGKCGTSTCFICGRESHKSGPCPASVPKDSNEDKQTLDHLAEKHKWKRCPTCRRWIEFNGGCPDVVCRCGKLFCWNCGKKPCVCSRAGKALSLSPAQLMEVRDNMAAIQLGRQLVLEGLEGVGAWRTKGYAGASSTEVEENVIDPHWLLAMEEQMTQLRTRARERLGLQPGADEVPTQSSLGELEPQNHLDTTGNTESNNSTDPLWSQVAHGARANADTDAEMDTEPNAPPPPAERIPSLTNDSASPAPSPSPAPSFNQDANQQRQTRQQQQLTLPGTPYFCPCNRCGARR